MSNLNPIFDNLSKNWMESDKFIRESIISTNIDVEKQLTKEEQKRLKTIKELKNGKEKNIDNN